MTYPVNGQLGSGTYSAMPNPLQSFATPSPYSSMSSWGAPVQRTFPIATANGATAANAPSPYDEFLQSIGVNPSTTGQWASPSNSEIAASIGADGTSPGLFSSLGDWMKNSGVLGSYDPKTGIKTDGWGGLALGAAQGLGGLFMGLQQYNLAKDTLENNKAQFERNYAAQRTTTNANLEDRQRARVASNAGAYQSVGDYMAQNGVK